MSLVVARPAGAFDIWVDIYAPLAHVTPTQNIDDDCYINHGVVWGYLELDPGFYWVSYRGALYQENFQGDLADWYGTDYVDALDTFTDEDFNWYYDYSWTQTFQGGPFGVSDDRELVPITDGPSEVVACTRVYKQGPAAPPQAVPLLDSAAEDYTDFEYVAN